jgi:hypothetical protein
MVMYLIVEWLNGCMAKWLMNGPCGRKTIEQRVTPVVQQSTIQPTIHS